MKKKKKPTTLNLYNYGLGLKCPVTALHMDLKNSVCKQKQLLDALRRASWDDWGIERLSWEFK